VEACRQPDKLPKGLKVQKVFEVLLMQLQIGVKSWPFTPILQSRFSWLQPEILSSYSTGVWNTKMWIFFSF
jgi:hypothetical protein